MSVDAERGSRFHESKLEYASGAGDIVGQSLEIGEDGSSASSTGTLKRRPRYEAAG